MSDDLFFSAIVGSDVGVKATVVNSCRHSFSVDSRRSAKNLLPVRMPVKCNMFEKVLIFLMNMTPLTEQKHSCCLKVVLAVPGYLFSMGETDLPGRF